MAETRDNDYVYDRLLKKKKKKTCCQQVDNELPDICPTDFVCTFREKFEFLLAL